MDWQSLKKRLKPKVRYRTGPFVMPAVALEVEPGFVAGARLNRGTRQVERLAVREFDAPAFQALPNRPNFSSGPGPQEAIRSVAETIGGGGGNVGLLVPDGATRVGVLSFETLPGHHDEADSLVRWRLKDLLPFDLEESRVSYQMLSNEPGNIELLAIAARGSVLAEYEAALEHLNGGAVLVLPATMALLPLLPKTEASGQVLIHVCSGWITTVVVIGDRVRLWRNRDLAAREPGGLVNDVAREAARVLASSRDHFKVEIERAWLCVRPPLAEDVGKELGRLLSQQVEPLTCRPDFVANLPESERIPFERFGATFAGLVGNSS